MRKREIQEPILSNMPPVIEELGSAPADAGPARKSRILYHPEDREETERLVEDLSHKK